MTYIANRDYAMEVALGNVSGISGINKFGVNHAILQNTREDIWDVGGYYPFPASGTAPITHIHSIDAGDSEPILISGLDIAGNAVDQTITLNGTTLVALTTPLWREFRMKNNGSTALAGTVLCTDSVNNVIYSQLDLGMEQTLMAIYTIPKGKIGVLTSYYATVVESTGKEPKSTTFGLWARDTKVNGVFQAKHAIGIPKAGSMVVHEFNPYYAIPELTDIRMTALPDTEDGDVAGGFNLYLKDM